MNRVKARGQSWKTMRQHDPHPGVRDWQAQEAITARDADGARPADLVFPDFSPGRLGEIRLNDNFGEERAPADSGDAPGKLIVVGDVVGNGFETAGLFQILAAEAERGAQTEFADADQRGD